ncbi:hypothetical protein FGO68_gene12047 [Halteria grandinella]|uniref:Uncharacterized protein n=1 Tax=Halteria grandinella TaxID=5974 RepID=A0A8J8NQV4_HALGN|nr:hypothetical protein FGO68_gene12047 [Halteria grandinella]
MKRRMQQPPSDIAYPSNVATTVNYFITNPNFAPSSQNTTNNIIIMNPNQSAGGGSTIKNRGSSKHSAIGSAGHKKASIQVAASHQTQQPPAASSDLLKLFGNEKNFQLIKSLMDNTKDQPRTLQNARVLPPPKQPNKFMDNLVTDKEVKVEKALLDLNELKTQMYQEQANASAYKESNPRKMLNTQTNNFFRDTAYSSANNQVKPGSSIGKMRPFSGAQVGPSMTQTSFFSQSGFNPANSLTQNIDNMDASQLKERLLVAETLLKKLYNRNREVEGFLEEKFKENVPKSDVEDNPEQAIPYKASQRESELIQELEEKQKLIDNLNTQIQDLVKSKGETQRTTYTEFLESRLRETQEENRRMLSKYSEMRAFAYSQLESLIVQSQKLRPNNQQAMQNLQVYKQVMERDKRHWEHELTQRQTQLENAFDKAKRLDSENLVLKSRIEELEQEIVEREACEAQVQEMVKQLLAEKAKTNC